VEKEEERTRRAMLIAEAKEARPLKIRITGKRPKLPPGAVESPAY